MASATQSKQAANGNGTAAPVEHKTLAEALVAFQAEAPSFAKGKTARVPTKNGGEYTYKYADLGVILPAIRPLLARHGLAWMSKPAQTDSGDLVLEFRVLHASGEDDCGEIPLGVSKGCRPQELGSAITYARRYALTAQLNLATEEDDDGGAAERAERPAREASRPTTPELPPETVTRVIEAFKAAGTPTDWLRMQLVAVGAENVPEGQIMQSTIQSLTPEQATKVIEACEEVAAARAKAEAKS